MIFFLALIFALAVACLAFGYLGYPLLIRYGPRALWPAPLPDPRPVAGCVVLCAAHNEREVIGAMVDAALAGLDQGDAVVVVSDSSTDGTDEEVLGRARRDRRVRLERLEGRGGKNRALNQALVEIRRRPEAAVIFTDANATLDPAAPAHLLRALRAGASCAVGRVEFTHATSGTAIAEGLYWRYENAIKLAESRLGRLPVGNGALFALRAGDCTDLPEATGNDLYWPLGLLGSGRRVVFVPEAVAREPATLAGQEEFRRKRRMAARQVHGFRLLWTRLDGPTRLQFLCHKGIRWLGLPLLLVALVAAGGLGITIPVARVAVAALFVPFAAAAVHAAGLRTRVSALATHFLSVQTAALLGLWDDLRGRRRGIWGSPASARRR